MKIGFFIASLFCFLSLHTFAQKPIPESLLVAVKNATTAETKINTLIDAGDFYYQLYNAVGYSKAANYYEQAREVANTTGDSILIGKAYHSLAQVYDAVGDDKLNRALEYYQLFKRTAFISADTTIILRAYVDIAHTQMRLEQVTNCISTLKELEIIAKKYNKIKLTNRCYVVSAYTLMQLKKYDLSRQYFNKIDLQNDTISNGSLAFGNWYYLTQLHLLAVEKKYDEALKAGEAGLRVCTNQSDSMAIMKNMAEFAAHVGNYQLAFKYRNYEFALYGSITRGNSFNDVNNALLKTELKLKDENTILLQNKQLVQKKITFGLVAGLILMALALSGIFMLALARRKQNKELEKQAAENKLLLQEIHHRVKNNLQIVNSFLLLEENKENGGGKSFLQEMQTKVQAMAMIHQKLHSNQEFNQVELQPYFEQLVSNVISSHTKNNEQVEFSITANNLYMRQDKVISLALITTELLLNSIKYVAKHTACKITLNIKVKEAMLVYQYTDNGTGFPFTFNFEKVTTTGLMLVKQLTKQLKGTISIIKNENDNGFAIILPKE